jgi:hypothetical protein
MLRKSLNPITDATLVLLAADRVRAAESGGRISVQEKQILRFTQDDMPLGRCPQPPNRRNPSVTSFRRPGRPSGPRFRDSGGGSAGSFYQFATRHFAATNWYERSRQLIENKHELFLGKHESRQRTENKRVSFLKAVNLLKNKGVSSL